MDREQTGRRFAQLDEALGDNPALFAVLVRANGERLAYTYPFLQHLGERAGPDYSSALRAVHRGLVATAAEVESTQIELERLERDGGRRG